MYTIPYYTIYNKNRDEKSKLNFNIRLLLFLHFILQENNFILYTIHSIYNTFYIKSFYIPRNFRPSPADHSPKERKHNLNKHTFNLLRYKRYNLYKERDNPTLYVTMCHWRVVSLLEYLSELMFFQIIFCIRIPKRQFENTHANWVLNNQVQ